MRLFSLLRFLLAAVTLFTFAQAQDLAKLLPADTFFALGIRDWAGHREKLQPYVDEFTRLELGKALMELGASSSASDDTTTDDMTTGDAAQSTQDFLKEWQKRFGDTDLLDMFGQEAWIGVSATTSNPLPAVILLTKLTPEVSTQFAAVIAEENPKQKAETLTEGDLEFYTFTDTTGDTPMTFAYALQQDTLMLSTNPDTLRGVLRQLGGSSDPNFTTSEGYASSLATFEPGNAYSYLDLPVIADVLAPFAKQAGFDAIIDRFAKAFKTAGVSAGVSRFTDEGTETQGLQAVNPAGGDASLLALLTTSGVADKTVLDRAPADALAVSSSYTNLTGWWDYLNELAAVQPELGGDLDTILQGFGLDLRGTFFSWAGSQVFSITTGIAETVEPGVAASNLLGEAVYMVEASDETAAQEGLTTLVQTISTQVAAFADPSGGTGSSAETTTDIAGVSVTNFEVTSGVNLSYAVNGGYALLATSQDAMKKVLSAGESGSLQGVEAIQPLLSVIPEDASSFTISNDRVTMQSTAGQLSSSLQTAAGMGGASNLDFDKVEAASAKAEEFLKFVAERLGYSVGYSQQSETGTANFGKTEVKW
jgi:hypothetical protein